MRTLTLATALPLVTTLAATPANAADPTEGKQAYEHAHYAAALRTIRSPTRG